MQHSLQHLFFKYSEQTNKRQESISSSIPKNFDYNFPFEDVCMQPVDPGTCRKIMLRWYFSAEDESCAPFYYSGCDGNENNFETYQECFAICTKASRLSTNKCLLLYKISLHLDYQLYLSNYIFAIFVKAIYFWTHFSTQYLHLPIQLYVIFFVKTLILAYVFF